jgi:hypothetical protein
MAAARPSITDIRRAKPQAQSPARAAAPQRKEPDPNVWAITLRFTTAMMRDLKLRAMDERRHVSEIVREAVTDYLGKVGGTKVSRHRATAR